LQRVWELRKTYKIRVVNLSFGLAPRGTLPNADPLLAQDELAVATKKLVKAGIFVVAAGGNLGQLDGANCDGLANQPAAGANGKCEVWGGITRPGTYPWVFTAGANSSEGSFTRTDDIRAAFSSRGPAFPLQNAKPDVLAGAVGIESVSAPGSTLYQDAGDHGFLVGAHSTSEPFPYMALSGTSQAAAVVSGVAAQMLQANPKLTPNLIKAILEYTSQEYDGYTPLEQGAGFLNALGAVRLSAFYAKAHRGDRVPVSPLWSKHIIWGNHQLSGGIMLPNANAWDDNIVWGTAQEADGDNIVWGTSCGSADCGDNIVWGTSSGDNIVWGTADADNIVWGTIVDGDNIVWGTAGGDDNIVWGTSCGGQDCGDNIVWGTAGQGDNIVWGTASLDDNIVWGTANAGDNIVWGTASDGSDNIVWGTNQDGDNIVWGTASDADNIVWGTAADNDNIVWGTAADNDNIVWGTASDGDNIVWGTASDGDNIVWGTISDTDNIVWGTVHGVGRPTTQADWYQLFLNRGFSAWWVGREFADGAAAGDGHPLKVNEAQERGHQQGSSGRPGSGRGGSGQGGGGR
jgi:hypothetical protein